MILPDVNVLVYAYRREADQHDVYADWLSELVRGADELALVDHCLAGMVRIVTNPRIMADPAPTREAMHYVAAIRAAVRGRDLSSTSATWATMARLVQHDRGVRGNLVPDAYLAAMAISHGCRLATADRGFARFDGLDHFDPAAA